MDINKFGMGLVVFGFTAFVCATLLRIHIACDRIAEMHKKMFPPKPESGA